MDSLDFEWMTSGGKRREGRGEDYSSWKGTATQDLRFTVMVAIPHSGNKRRVVFMSDSIVVRPRSWELPEQSADTQYVPITGRKWGEYNGGAPSPEKLKGTEKGSGPWEGTWILADEQPSITGAVGFVSWDLVSGSQEGQTYKLVHETCGLPAGDSIGVYDLNAVHCDNEAAIDAWKATVVEHEFEHENSLNECVKALNTDGRLAAIEAIVKDEKEGGEGEVKRRPRSCGPRASGRPSPKRRRAMRAMSSGSGGATGDGRSTAWSSKPTPARTAAPSKPGRAIGEDR